MKKVKREEIVQDYKRAVIKPAPKHFYAQVLSPTKIGTLV